MEKWTSKPVFGDDGEESRDYLLHHVTLEMFGFWLREWANTDRLPMALVDVDANGFIHTYRLEGQAGPAWVTAMQWRADRAYVNVTEVGDVVASWLVEFFDEVTALEEPPRQAEPRGAKAGTLERVREAHELLKKNPVKSRAWAFKKARVDPRTYLDRCKEATGEDPILAM